MNEISEFVLQREQSCISDFFGSILKYSSLSKKFLLISCVVSFICSKCCENTLLCYLAQVVKQCMRKFDSTSLPMHVAHIFVNNRWLKETSSDMICINLFFCIVCG